jgi:hypothetical protein
MFSPELDETQQNLEGLSTATTRATLIVPRQVLRLSGCIAGIDGPRRDTTRDRGCRAGANMGYL